jgi:hypothetical protein
MTEYLNPTELHSLTGYARATAQAAWLAQHSIPHRLDGKRIIVSRVHVLSWLEGRNMAQSTGLNMAAIK